MKIVKIVVGIVIFLALLVIVGRFAYSLGQHNASLSIKAATSKQLAETMQSDSFYGEYTKTMLLVTGRVMTVNKHGTDTIAQFAVSSSPTALGKVSCDLVNNTSVKAGDTIRVLTVAHDAERQNTADVFMQNCYVLK